MKAMSGVFQRVFLLTLKNGDGLLKGRESSKEFDSCPAIDGSENDSAATLTAGDEEFPRKWSRFRFLIVREARRSAGGP
jgi:hypothetical protein